MASPSVDLFVEAVKQTVLADKKWVPPPGKGDLYIRPLLIGSGANLGIAPAPEYTFLIYASPVGYYHKGSSGMNLQLIISITELILMRKDDDVGSVEESEEEHDVQAGLSSPVCPSSPLVNIPAENTSVPIAQRQSSTHHSRGREAKSSGFSDVLQLGETWKRHLHGNIVSTPPTSGTILPGITRKSITELVLDIGYQIQERDVSVDELLEAEEVFCTGTAVVVKAVETVTFHDKK
ncbi:hypothetical protein Bca4012_064038 [Brassica carinata]|uniref:Branched-chain-amino-acid aminotransferase n=1 Tax=Brassica carinata TaxID=52824 RepID=A0A8X7SED0_BRACI|nr:hypothetical protein Bca52824_033458 [Brassica carinata]